MTILVVPLNAWKGARVSTPSSVLAPGLLRNPGAAADAAGIAGEGGKRVLAQRLATWLQLSLNREVRRRTFEEIAETGKGFDQATRCE
jgi:hypothetical protein